MYLKKCVSGVVVLTVMFTHILVINASLENARYFRKPTWEAIKQDKNVTQNILNNWNKLKQEELKKQQEIERQEKLQEIKQHGQQFRVTFYDLSINSCGKYPGQTGYGITATGINLSGQTWQTAKVIAVDPNIIALGSKAELVFQNPSLSFMNGIYTCGDTGSAIQGNIIDFYLGENCDSLADKYGIQSCWIKILN